MSGNPHITAILHIGPVWEKDENAREPVLIGPVCHAEIEHRPTLRRGSADSAGNDSTQEERWDLAFLSRRCWTAGEYRYQNCDELTATKPPPHQDIQMRHIIEAIQ